MPRSPFPRQSRWYQAYQSGYRHKPRTAKIRGHWMANHHPQEFLQVSTLSLTSSSTCSTQSLTLSHAEEQMLLCCVVMTGVPAALTSPTPGNWWVEHSYITSSAGPLIRDLMGAIGRGSCEVRGSVTINRCMFHCRGPLKFP